MSDHDTIREFIAKRDHGTLATVSSEGNPEAAIVEYAETPHLELIIDTSTEYRKYANLLSNPKIAFTVGDRELLAGIQYEGTARLLGGTELEAMKALFFAKCPNARKFEAEPTTVYFLIDPAWIRLRDYRTQPATVIEITFP